MFFSKRSASLSSRWPRFPGVSFLHGPSKAFRAAATAMSTSFSVASWTETMTVSSVGLMTSKVFPSAPLTHSLLMKLVHLSALLLSDDAAGGSARHRAGPEFAASVSGRRGGYLQAGRLFVLAAMRRLELGGEAGHDCELN